MNYETIFVVEKSELDLVNEINYETNIRKKDYDVIHIDTFIDNRKLYEYRAIIVFKRKGL